MKILTGVLYTVENEFDQCIESIEKQTYKDHDYFIIEKLPNKEAHDKLYQTFMDNSEKYDLFIKVDADMVLARDTFFAEVVNYFATYPEVDDLQIAVHDFFTNRLIYGLHVYSNRMKWKQEEESIFVDWSEERGSYKRVNDKVNLAPAAYHCPNPSKFQSFHFGLHKAVKITQYERKGLRYFACVVHWDNVLELLKHFQTNKDIALAFAIIGVYEGIKQKVTSDEINFDSKRAISLFQQYNSRDDQENLLQAEQISDSLLSLPSNLQLQIILFQRSKDKNVILATVNFIENILINRLAKYRKNQ